MVVSEPEFVEGLRAAAGRLEQGGDAYPFGEVESFGRKLVEGAKSGDPSDAMVLRAGWIVIMCHRYYEHMFHGPKGIPVELARRRFIDAIQHVIRLCPVPA